MHFFERTVGGRSYHIAAQAVWDATKGQSYSRQVVLGPAGPAPTVDLSSVRTAGTRRIGDVGALVWVAEQLDLVARIDRSCGTAAEGPQAVSLGEMVLAVAIQRACCPGAKCDLADFLDGSIPRVSCLPGKAFTGQVFHRLAATVDDDDLERAQVELARAVVERFKLTTDVLAFDTTNFDTHIASTTAGTLARRGHAKSKRSDLRVVGLGMLVSETGHVPLLYRSYAGNGSDQEVLSRCLSGLGELHDALDRGEHRKRAAARTVVRDGGSWSEELELGLEFNAGFYSLISLPLSHSASERALAAAAQRGAMKPLGGALDGVRAARMRDQVGVLDRTLVVVESEELLKGQKRGIAAALRKARVALRALERREGKRALARDTLERRIAAILRREHLRDFVEIEYGGTEAAANFRWRVDAARRLKLERTRLGRRVLCTDQHGWKTERIVQAFRGQWNVEELFRRAKKGGVVPWGPSFQWADASLRLHTFATVVGLMLVSLVRLTLGARLSARGTMKSLAQVEATLVRTVGTGRGRRPTTLLLPDLTADQAKAAKLFELDRWAPGLLSTSVAPRRKAGKEGVS